MSTRRAGNPKTEVTYVADLVEAGMDGVVSVWRGTADRPLPQGWTRAIWAPTVVGAAIGVLTAYLDRNHPRPGHKLAFSGLVGSAVGFGVGVAWTSRAFTGAAARSAMQKMNAVRDAHWLERNPIAYA